ncbi:uncharacterized protein LOC100899427 [Galendromus occidentalis]|uniref:Uncharacterized protein LOC100899427 n=1 Tax=Galendromus occidentalis TaxID=34638 RepID=A0AAJ7SGN1_9ACAR|nr:uncharacterized protein LOC100899427 [Galendromus occidentalis]
MKGEGGQQHILSAWPNEVSVHGDLGSRLTLHCNISIHSLEQLQATGIVWKKDGEIILGPLSGWRISKHQINILKLNLTQNDSGNYTCQPVGPELRNVPVMSASLTLRTPPEKLANLTVTPSIVYTSIRWAIHGDGGSPITHFTLVYQQVLQIRVSSLAHNLDSEAVSKTLDAEHHRSTHLPIHISPAARQFFVYHLRPNALYMFKMWATNRIGRGEASVLYISTHVTGNTTIQSLEEYSNITLATAKPMKYPSLGYSDEDLSSTAWLIGVSMVLSTVVVLALLSCVLIYKEASNDDLAGETFDDDFSQTRSAAMQILLDPARSFRRFYRPQVTPVLSQKPEERTVLLADSDCNDNSGIAPPRLNNNSLLLPSSPANVV